MRLARIVLSFAALEIFGVGLVYLVTPQTMLAGADMAIRTVNEAHFARSGYGGLFMAFGALFALGAAQTRWTRPALVALATFMGGFAFGRIASLVVDGMPATTYLFALATEIAFALAAVHCLRRAATQQG